MKRVCGCYKKIAKLRKSQDRPSWHKQVQLPRERLFCNAIPLRYSPFPGHQWARFAYRFISFLTPFFAFFPHCGSWSQATQMVSQLQTQLTMHVFGTGSSLSHPSRTHLSLSAHPLDALESWSSISVMILFFVLYHLYQFWICFFWKLGFLGPVNFWFRDFFGFFVGSPSLLFSFDFCPH